MSSQSITDYLDSWDGLVEEKGHVLERDEDGEVDDFAVSEGFHNGPRCTRCHENWCMHCTPPDQVEPCDGGVAHGAYVARADRKEWEHLVSIYGSEGPAHDPS